MAIGCLYPTAPFHYIDCHYLNAISPPPKPKPGLEWGRWEGKRGGDPIILGGGGGAGIIRWGESEERREVDTDGGSGSEEEEEEERPTHIMGGSGERERERVLGICAPPPLSFLSPSLFPSSPKKASSSFSFFCFPLSSLLSAGIGGSLKRSVSRRRRRKRRKRRSKSALTPLSVSLEQKKHSSLLLSVSFPFVLMQLFSSLCLLSLSFLRPWKEAVV